jgi:hypothetical protein
VLSSSSAISGFFSFEEPGREHYGDAKNSLEAVQIAFAHLELEHARLFLQKHERWVRLRLRAAMWRQWKTPRRRRAALLELGVREPLASNTDGSGRGPWYLAKAKALAVGLSNAYFKSDFRHCSRTVSVTVSNRRVRTRTHGGVAGVGG